MCQCSWIKPWKPASNPITIFYYKQRPKNARGNNFIVYVILQFEIYVTNNRYRKNCIFVKMNINCEFEASYIKKFVKILVRISITGKWGEKFCGRIWPQLGGYWRTRCQIDIMGPRPCCNSLFWMSHGILDCPETPPLQVCSFFGIELLIFFNMHRVNHGHISLPLAT